MSSTLLTRFVWDPATAAPAAKADLCCPVCSVLVSVTLDSLTELSEVVYLDDSLDMLDWSSVRVVPSEMLDDSVGYFGFAFELATIAFGWFNVDDFRDVVGPGSSSASAPTDSCYCSSCSDDSDSGLAAGFFLGIFLKFCVISFLICSSFSAFCFFPSGESLNCFYFLTGAYFATFWIPASRLCYISFSLFLFDFLGCGISSWPSWMSLLGIIALYSLLSSLLRYRFL